MSWSVPTQGLLRPRLNIVGVPSGAEDPAPVLYRCDLGVRHRFGNHSAPGIVQSQRTLSRRIEHRCEPYLHPLVNPILVVHGIFCRDQQRLLVRRQSNWYLRERMGIDWDSVATIVFSAPYQRAG